MGDHESDHSTELNSASTPAPRLQQQKNSKTLKSMKSFTSRVGIPDRRPFDDWSKSQLVRALVEDGHVIRNEHYIEASILKSFAETVFANRPIPPKPAPYSEEEQQRRHTAALTIQNAYFASLISALEGSNGQVRPPEESQHDAILRVMHSNVSDHSPKTSSSKHKKNQQEHQFERIEERDEGHLTDDVMQSQMAAQLSVEDDDDTVVRNSILEEEFIPPSVEYATLYADYNHPRLGGLGGKKMPWLRTSTGRHCVSGGWGEQCDMFEERQVSELGRYGPGITNYFKFLKWSFWIFVFLSIAWLPVLVLNTFGVGDNQSAKLNDLSQTMVGNLGDTNHTKSLHFPGCTDSIRGQSCQLDKYDVALYYAFTDLVCTIVVIVGYIWLRFFEVKEAQLLDKNSLSAANYTIEVKGFNTSEPVTEKELKMHFKQVTGQDVAAVAIAYDNEREIQLYKKRGELMMGRLRCTREYQYHRTRQRDGEMVLESKLFEVLSRRVELTASIRDLDAQTEKCQDNEDKPLCAFVTFENAIAARLAVRTYNKSIWGYLRMKRSLRYKKAKLSVAAAAEPSTIIWENLKYNKLSRAKRRVVSTVITLVLLAISAIANIVARGLEQNATSEGGDEYCPGGFFDSSKEEQQSAIEKNDDLLHCYCDQYTLREQFSDSYCKTYAEQNLLADFFVYVAAFVVVCTNGAISLFLSRISAYYEKHHSVDSMEKSIFLRMFILKLINMGVLFLTMNFWVTYLKDLGIEYQATQNFSTLWYKTIGVSMVLVQTGNIVGPHMYKFYFYNNAKKKQQAAIEDPVDGGLTQIDLNKLFLGPDFSVSHRYAQILADIFICFIFTAGMPILTIIGMLNFYTTYWVDKFLFLNYYRSPPRYKTNIGRGATALIPYAIVLHLVASIWMLGNKDIFHAESDQIPIDDEHKGWNILNVREKITQKHTFPLFVLCLITVFGILLGHLADRLWLCLTSLARMCCGSCMAKSEFYQEMEQYMFNTINIPYTRAVRRGIIKGLTNYNILQNPKYKEAFAITDVFAMNHSRVKSLRHFEKLSFDDISTADASQPAAPKPNKRKTKHANPDAVRLANAGLEMQSKPRAEDEALLGSDQSHQREQEPPSPLLMQLERSTKGSEQTYARLGDQEDDDASVASSSTSVTRVTGVLLSDDQPNRPTSASIDMQTVFRGSGSDRPPSMHGNPLYTGQSVSQSPSVSSSASHSSVKTAKRPEDRAKEREHRRMRRPSPAEQRHLEEFKEGTAKKHKKKGNFMNTGKM